MLENLGINKKYFIDRLDKLLTIFYGKNQDIDMNNKNIKNLSWPNDNNDAGPKKYLYHDG